MATQAPAPSRAGRATHGAVKARPLFDPPIVKRAILDSFLKLDPQHPAGEPGDLRGRGRLASSSRSGSSPTS